MSINAIGTIRSGEVVLDSPIDWPEGTPVEVVRATKASGPVDRLGDGTPYPTTDTGVRELLRRMEAIEPFDMAEDEYEAFQEEIRTTRNEQKALLKREAEKIDQLFE